MNKTKLIVISFLVIGICVLPYADAIIILKEIGPKNSFLDESSGSGWATLQNNNQRTGFTEGSAPSEENLLWKNDDHSGAYRVSPVIDNGKLYIYDSHRFYVLDAFTGREIHSFDFGSESNYFADDDQYFSPVIYEDKIYVCGEYKVERFVWEGAVYCYDLNDYYEIWKIRTPGLIEGCLSVFKDKVYFVADQVYCLDANSGYEIWTYEVNESATSQAMSEEYLVFGLEESQKMVCLDAEFGDEIWTYDTNQEAGNIITTPTIYDNYVYFTSNGTLYCLDIYYGYEYWYAVTEAIRMTPAAVAYEKIFVGSYNGILYCFDAYGGSIEWTYQTPWGYYRYEPIKGSIAIADNKIYFGGGGSDHSWYPQGYIYCLDAQDGYELWKYKTYSLTEGTPAIAYGVVYVSTFDGFFALGEEISGPRPPEIHGTTYGENGNVYEYTFLSIDLSGSDLYYYIEWGDGEDTGWLGPYIENEPCEAYHEWDDEGAYTIRAKAKNSDDEVSDWATMEVTMPRHKSRDNLFEILLNKFMRLSLKFGLLKSI